MTKKLLVEGWRGINHSYAMVNQYQLLELVKSNLDLYHQDVPFYKKEWNPSKNFCGFDLESIKVLESIKSLDPVARPDIIYRIGFPYNLLPAKSEKLFVFGTSEHQVVHRNMMVLGSQAGSYRNLPLTIITPSNWSKIGFINSGFSEDQVKVISHGVDLSIFKPLDIGVKRRYRELFGADDQTFVMLSVGAMTANKGIDVLLSAYIHLKKIYPQLKLVLKDQSNLYGYSANDCVNYYLNERNIHVLTNEINDAISDIVFITSNLDLNQLNVLYNAADCYVSPYRAEGFNLPPLEAAAAGIPIVVTEGGSTDDYAHSSFALKIKSEKKFSDGQNYLEPHLDSLVDQLTTLIEGKNLKFNMSDSRQYIANNFSWKVVCDNLIVEMG